jgi:ATP-binding cassette subfamily B protein
LTGRLGRRVLQLFRPHLRLVGLTLLIILVSSGLGVVNPILTKVLFDQALFPSTGYPNLDLLYALVGSMIVITIIVGAAGVGQTYCTTLMGQRLMRDLRERLFAHLQSMSLRFFTSARTGELQSRLNNDVGGIERIVTDTASSLLVNIVVVLSSLAAMAVLSWQLTLLSLSCLPVFTYFTNRVGRERRNITESTQRLLADITVLTEENLSVSGVLLTKVFNRSSTTIERFRRRSQRLSELKIRQQMVGRTFLASTQTFFAVMPVLAYLVAGLMMSRSSAPAVSPGTLVAFTTLQVRLFFPLMQILQGSVDVQASLALFDRIFQYLDLRSDIADKPGVHRVSKDAVRGSISLRGVYFRYANCWQSREELISNDRVMPLGPHPRCTTRVGTQNHRNEPQCWALEDVDLEIEAGQLAALVGPSGAGKTTLSYLLPRLYEATRGVVEIDGVDVRNIALTSLADAIGVATQESYLFHATVRENLLYARPDAAEGDIHAAASAAAIHDRILELDEGYDTVVGERGYRMSGGERQRLAIARVILKDPRILVLDEATASLDTTNERLIQSALEPLMRSRTTVAIAHRLSTILAADVIFVLDGGRIVERGTHRELLSNCGAYANLYKEQFADGLVERRVTCV